MNRRSLFLQLLLTLFVLGFVESNALKVCLLLPLWWFSFDGLTKNEAIVFVVVNAVFVFIDIAAIRSGLFQFTHPDIWGLPYYEFIMWGFYLLHTHRFLQVKYPPVLDLKILLLAIVFFSLLFPITDQQTLLLSISGIFLLSLAFYHDKEDGLFFIYMMLMGALFQTVGVKRDLWIYPNSDIYASSIQFLLVWGAAGFFQRRIVGPWLAYRVPTPPHIYQLEHLPLHHSVSGLYMDAKKSKAAGDRGAAWNQYQHIEAVCRDRVLPLNFKFCMEAAELAVLEGYVRRSIELYRKALKFVTSPTERAEVHWELSGVYHMMIRIENARSELQQAFRILNIEYPAQSLGTFLTALAHFIASFFPKDSVALTDSERNRLTITNRLYEEAGFSAYYYGEYVPLIQCILIPRGIAYRLGPSREMVDWLGGSACVLSLLGLTKLSDDLLKKADRVGETLDDRKSTGKALVWHAIAQDYKGDPVRSARSFSRLVDEFNNDLPPKNIVLCCTNLAINLFLRGHMLESNRVVESRFAPSSSLNSTTFSRIRTFIDWYRIPALSFLGAEEEVQDIIQRSKAIFSSIDVEKWQITQFLGGLLIYYYTREENPLEEIEICFQRFEALRLRPRTTYREACYYWVARAHVMVDSFRSQKVPERRVRQALSELARTPAHPSFLAHRYVLKAKFLRSMNLNSNIQPLLTLALDLAQKYDNDWVKFEVYALQSPDRALELARNKGWHNRVRWLERSTL